MMSHRASDEESLKSNERASITTSPLASDPTDGSDAWEPDLVSTRHPSHYILTKIEVGLTGTLIVGIFVLVLLQVITRYVFASPLSWTEEAARLTLVWLTFIAAAFVSSRASHIAVDLFDRLLPRRLKRTLDRSISIFTAIVSAFLVYAGISLLAIVWHLRLPATQLPTPILYGAATAGFFLLTVHSVYWAVAAPTDVNPESTEDIS